MKNFLDDQLSETHTNLRKLPQNFLKKIAEKRLRNQELWATLSPLVEYCVSHTVNSIWTFNKKRDFTNLLPLEKQSRKEDNFQQVIHTEITAMTFYSITMSHVFGWLFQNFDLNYLMSTESKVDLLWCGRWPISILTKKYIFKNWLRKAVFISQA